VFLGNLIPSCMLPTGIITPPPCFGLTFFLVLALSHRETLPPRPATHRPSDSMSCHVLPSPAMSWRVLSQRPFGGILAENARWDTGGENNPGTEGAAAAGRTQVGESEAHYLRCCAATRGETPHAGKRGFSSRSAENCSSLKIDIH